MEVATLLSWILLSFVLQLRDSFCISYNGTTSSPGRRNTVPKIPYSKLLDHLKSGRIIGGKVDDPTHSHPWQLLLILNNNLCGATLLTPIFAITASHCVPTGTIQTSKIVAGAHVWCTMDAGGSINMKTESSQQVTTIKKVYRPPFTYNQKDQKFDLTILELKAALTLNSFVAVANLPISSTAPGTLLDVSGWGTTSEDGQISCELRTVTVSSVNVATCNVAYEGVISATQICAGTAAGGKDSCQGDSGGPLVVVNGTKATLVGIVSFGIGCGRPEIYGVYTNVYSYLPWIKSVIARKPVSGCTSGKSYWIGDGFCDDELNNAGCIFDAGDCCESEKKNFKEHCKICNCVKQN